MTSFDFAQKAGRFYFAEDEEYAGKLIGVSQRPIENTSPNMLLLRFEFEIFFIDNEPDPFELHPTGGVASRDLVITPQATSDEGLARYASALSVQFPNDAKQWYRLEQLAGIKTLARQRWVRIHFGAPDVQADFRQPFESITRLEAPEKKQLKQDSTTNAVRTSFVSVQKIRKLLVDKKGKSPSDDKVIEFVERLAKKWGKRLMYKTNGGHRRINWYLCWHLWEAERCATY